MADSTVVRYSLPLVLAIIGFAIAGGAGLAIGFLAPLLWPLFRNICQRNVDINRADAGRVGGPPVSFGALALIVALPGHGVLFMSYSVLIGLWRNSRDVAGWVSAFQPAIGWLEAVISGVSTYAR